MIPSARVICHRANVKALNALQLDADDFISRHHINELRNLGDNTGYIVLPFQPEYDYYYETNRKCFGFKSPELYGSVYDYFYKLNTHAYLSDIRFYIEPQAEQSIIRFANNPETLIALLSL